LALPLLVFWPALIDELARRPGWRRLGRAALVLTAAASIYTEFWPVFLGVSVLVVGPALWSPGRRRRLLGCLAGLAAAPFLLNPGFAGGSCMILGRLGAPVLQHIYPWAFTGEGLGRLWLGDLAAGLPRWISQAIWLVGWAATLLGYAGLLRFCLARW